MFRSSRSSSRVLSVNASLSRPHAQARALRDAADACAASCEAIRACAICSMRAARAASDLQDAVALVADEAARMRTDAIEGKADEEDEDRDQDDEKAEAAAAAAAAAASESKAASSKPDPGADADNEASADAEDDGTAAGMQKKLHGLGVQLLVHRVALLQKTNREILSMQRELSDTPVHSASSGASKPRCSECVFALVADLMDATAVSVRKDLEGTAPPTRNTGSVSEDEARVAWWSAALHKRTEWMRTLGVTADVMESTARSPADARLMAVLPDARSQAFRLAGLIDKVRTPRAV